MNIGIVRLWNLYINAASLSNEQSLSYFIIIELLVYSTLSFHALQPKSLAVMNHLQ